MDNYIELISEEGSELFEILLRFRFNGTDYISLRPETEDDETAAIFEIRKAQNGEEEFLPIEDENIAKEVFVHFVSIWEMTEEDEEDDDDE